MSLEELRMLVLESEQFMPNKHQKMLLNLVDLGPRRGKRCDGAAQPD